MAKMHPCGHSHIQHHAMKIAPWGLAMFILIIAGLLVTLAASVNDTQVLRYQNNETRAQLRALGADYVALQDELAEVKEQYGVTQQQFRAVQKSNVQKEEELQQTRQILSTALTPPYISVEGQNVYTVFERSDGKLLEWVTPFDALNKDLQRGYFKREYVDTNLVPLHAEYATLAINIATDAYNEELTICNQYQALSNQCGEGDVGCQEMYARLNNERDDLHDLFEKRLVSLQEDGKEYLKFGLEGQQYTVLDFRPFVDPGTFTKIIPALHAEIGNDDAFVYEIWYIISQMTTYSSEIEETPKYPLETFLSGGGDCEDTAILVASMLKAVPRDWTVSLVYMDADHPDAPQDINHVIVALDTGAKKYFIETTSKSEMNPYDNVKGYYLTV